MLETSKDVLFIILAFCILWLTIFVSWLLYYLIKMFREAGKAIDTAYEFIDSLKEKLEKSTSHLLLIAELLKKGMDFMKERKNEEYKKETALQSKKRKRKK